MKPALSARIQFWLLTVVLAWLAIRRTNNEFHRLLLGPPPMGAIDLRMRYEEVQGWFSGADVYRKATACYPPEAMFVLWPLLGWLSFAAARILWAASTVALLYAVTRLTYRKESPRRNLLMALFLLALNSTGEIIGNGQLTLLVVLPMVAGLFYQQQGILSRGGDPEAQPGWKRDILVALSFLVGLAKPSLGAPFFWMLRWRPAALTAFGYVVLTWWTVGFSNESPRLLLFKLAQNTQAQTSGGYAEVCSWMTVIGLRRECVFLSAFILLGWGVWLHRHRRCDLWLRIGATSIVARMFTYHRLYDDWIVYLAEVALLRIASGQSDENNAGDPSGLHQTLSATNLAGPISVLVGLSLLVPSHLLLLPGLPGLLFRVFNAMSWLMALCFLVSCASGDRVVGTLPDETSLPQP